MGEGGGGSSGTGSGNGRGSGNSGYGTGNGNSISPGGLGGSGGSGSPGYNGASPIGGNGRGSSPFSSSNGNANGGNRSYYSSQQNSSAGSTTNQAAMALKKAIEESRAESIENAMRESYLHQESIKASIAERESIQSSIQERLIQESIQNRFFEKKDNNFLYPVKPDVVPTETYHQVETTVITRPTSNTTENTTRYQETLIPSSEAEITDNYNYETIVPTMREETIVPTEMYTTRELIVPETTQRISASVEIKIDPNENIRNNNVRIVETQEIIAPTAFEEQIVSEEVNTPTIDNVVENVANDNSTVDFTMETNNIDNKSENTIEESETVDEEGKIGDSENSGTGNSNSGKGNTEGDGSGSEEGVRSNIKIFEIDTKGAIGLKDEDTSNKRYLPFLIIITIVLLLIIGNIKYYLSINSKAIHKNNYF